MCRKAPNGPAAQQDNDATATLKSELSGIEINASDVLTLQFPRSGARDYTGQVGTLANIASKYDYATASVTVASISASGNINPVAATTTFTNGQYYEITVKTTMQAAGTDLSKLTGNYTAQDGETLTGTLGGNYKITIADGATVTLNGATINGTNSSYFWAGITCAGNATIILTGENTVKGFYHYYPGIYVPEGKKLTIKGDGSLNASSSGDGGAGIGAGHPSYCGPCGDIAIEGGTITATGGENAAGIGSGSNYSCGDITITNTVTKVTATKGDDAANSIGKGYGSYASCGTVTIGGTVGAITDSPYTYQP